MEEAVVGLPGEAGVEEGRVYQGGDTDAALPPRVLFANDFQWLYCSLRLRDFHLLLFYSTYLHSAQWPVASAARDGLSSVVGRKDDDGVVQHAGVGEGVVDSVHNLIKGNCGDY